ncbi:MAG TPA: lyase family protein, partial [Patescibacteria group bacterium]|nr:lyase family protein [Patescibacteria group bacterium]
MLRFEAALATVQGRAGLIPEEAARTIAAACEADRFDVTAIGLEAAESASPVVPLVAALRRAVGTRVAPFVHHGATSQDTLDTAMMLVARDGLDLLLEDIDALGAACASLARAHRATPMAARTLMQHALPTTFGYKAALWLEGVQDARRWLAALRQSGLAVQLGGPVGTFDRHDVVVELAAELGLTAPELPWHSVRSRVVELGSALAMAAGAAAKIALDVILLSQPEVGEVRLGKTGGSSSMPDKRNPAQAVESRAAFALAAAAAGALLSAMAGEHERAAGSWQSEWPALAELLRLTDGAVARTAAMLADLSVDAARMKANLGRAAG